MNKYICELESRFAYGRTLYYPLNKTAQRLAELVKCDTLTRLHIKRLRALGFVVNIYFMTNGTPMLSPDQAKKDV